MMDTSTLIAQLSSEAAASKLRSPRYWAVRLAAALAVYGVGLQVFYLGFRPDLATLWSQSLFVAEILLLTLVICSSILAGILAMYPDSYQRPKLLALPYFVFALLVALLGYELLKAPAISLPMTAREMECATCIAMVSIFPSALMFGMLRKGATIHPLRAGSFAVLAASAMGCLGLRLEEVDGSLMHLVVSHYLPTLVFAIAGAFIGRHLLRW
ncbi:MAG: NrsF family protein [Rickettsiales bacterium]